MHHRFHILLLRRSRFLPEKCRICFDCGHECLQSSIRDERFGHKKHEKAQRFNAEYLCFLVFLVAITFVAATPLWADRRDRRIHFPAMSYSCLRSYVAGI